MRKILLSILLITMVNYSQAQLFSGKNWDKGYCYTTNGKRVDGDFSGYIDSKNFLYRKNKSQNEVKNKFSTIQSLVIPDKKDTTKRDSFVVTHDPYFQKRPLLLVLADYPVNKLYAKLTYIKSTGPGFAPSMPGFELGGMVVSFWVGPGWNHVKKEYYRGPNPETLYPIKRENFIESMSILLADEPDLVEKIKNKKLKYKDMDDIAFYLKTGAWPAKPPKEVNHYLLQD